MKLASTTEPRSSRPSRTESEEFPHRRSRADEWIDYSSVRLRVLSDSVVDGSSSHPRGSPHEVRTSYHAHNTVDTPATVVKWLWPIRSCSLMKFATNCSSTWP